MPGVVGVVGLVCMVEKVRMADTVTALAEHLVEVQVVPRC